MKTIDEIRSEFPLLRTRSDAYLDNAATSQKPDRVLEAERAFYEHCNANPFRGLYALSEQATGLYESARQTVQQFVHAAAPEEIIFTRNATESLNLAAYSLGSLLLKPGDEILVTIAEHHSNLLPWQQAAARTGASLRYLECDPQGRFTEEALLQALTPRTRIFAAAHVSNVLGRAIDLKRFCRICHGRGVTVVADGSQSVPHTTVDVQDLDVDLLAFSGHKMLAPMGIGVLYGKKALLDRMPPFLTGGEMIQSVTREGAVFAKTPHKFEAGTVNAAGAVALAEAIRFLKELGMDFIREREERLTSMAAEGLLSTPGVRLLGEPDGSGRHGILAFSVEGVHPHDVAAILDADGVDVRAGHHCAQPLHAHLGIPSSTRASLAFYNTEEEVERFLKSVSQIRRKMGYE
ncbi:MAG: SufS family cysteine desulfurase [Eubacteriales bacterium]|nr:SufS family cysteine desulfurase [Eubacteriales bacterium]